MVYFDRAVAAIYARADREYYGRDEIEDMGFIVAVYSYGAGRSWFGNWLFSWFLHVSFNSGTFFWVTLSMSVGRGQGAAR